MGKGGRLRSPAGLKQTCGKAVLEAAAQEPKDQFLSLTSVGPAVSARPPSGFDYDSTFSLFESPVTLRSFFPIIPLQVLPDQEVAIPKSLLSKHGIKIRLSLSCHGGYQQTQFFCSSTLKPLVVSILPSLSLQSQQSSYSSLYP